MAVSVVLSPTIHEHISLVLGLGMDERPDLVALDAGGRQLDKVFVLVGGARAQTDQDGTSRQWSA